MIRCIAFDFTAKTDDTISLADAPAAMSAGKFVWIDAEFEGSPGAIKETVAKELAPVLGLSSPCLELLGKPQHDTGYEHLPHMLHMSMVACERTPVEAGLSGRIKATRVDALLADHFLLTIARGKTRFMDGIRNDYREDFHRFAASQGFLLYELWDHLTRSYESLEHDLEKEVEKIQTRMASRPDAQVFPLAAKVSSNLVRLRRHVAPARAVVHEIGTRRFSQVPQTTQPFLQSTAAELERVLTDLTTSREILTDAANLGMSFVSFRTNNIINRLTIVSFIFLPLTFLVGVYGMNFENQPEYKWRLGYLWFWGVAATVTLVATLIILLVWRRERTTTKA